MHLFLLAYIAFGPMRTSASLDRALPLLAPRARRPCGPSPGVGPPQRRAPPAAEAGRLSFGRLLENLGEVMSF